MDKTNYEDYIIVDLLGVQYGHRALSMTSDDYPTHTTFHAISNLSGTEC